MQQSRKAHAGCVGAAKKKKKKKKKERKKKYQP
jgi:hypothetical protein